MIDTKEAKRILEARWLNNKFEKLDQPEDTDVYSYIAIRVIPKADSEGSVFDMDDFDFLIWEPALRALEQSVAEDDDSKFYRVDVFCVDDILCVTSSRGDNPDEAEKESLIE